MDKQKRDYKVGDTCSFMLRGKMTPFKIIKDMDGIVRIQSLDLLWETTITGSAWLKQRRLLGLDAV